MKKILYTLLATVSGLVLLFSYHTSRSSVTAATTETRRVMSGQQSMGSSSSQSDSSSGTFTGDEVMTRYGVMQVQITVAAGAITSAEAVRYPMTDRHDQLINSQAVPIYNSEAVHAQSADIDVVSGATVTWEGYTSSLQSAIDRANL